MSILLAAFLFNGIIFNSSFLLIPNMGVQFEVEGKFIHKEEYFIFLKCLNLKENFKVTEDTTLNGMRLKPYIEIPRAVDEKGKQRLDLFVFKLQSGNDFRKIENGEIVELFDYE